MSDAARSPDFPDAVGSLQGFRQRSLEMLLQMAADSDTFHSKGLIVMKKRNVFAGVAVGALALGLWLGSFWKGPGLGGGGTGLGTGPESGVGTGTESRPTHVLSQASSEKIVPAGSSDPLDEGPTDMMTIVIYGDEYRLVIGDQPQAGKLLNLRDIGTRARKMTGTPEGIRVRILKGKSAQEGARADLLNRLTESGVKREEIQERAEFVE